MGVSCDGYEKEFTDLFVALEKDRSHISTKTPRRSSGKMVRELKGLESSVNYDGKVAVSRKNRSKGRALVTL